MKRTLVYYRGHVVYLKDDKTLPYREDVCVSFDGGKTKSSIHRDVQALKKALDENVLAFSFLPYAKNFMMDEIFQADDEVSDDVLDFIVKKAEEFGNTVDLDAELAMVNHPSVLEWLLKRGAKCKHVSGFGNSTLENFLYHKKRNHKFADEMIGLLKKYDAVDKNFLADDKNISNYSFDAREIFL